jgi:hypothetical protein
MRSYIKDGIGLVGVGLVSYGAWLVLPAAGFIVGGLFLIVGVLLNSLKPRPTK